MNPFRAAISFLVAYLMAAPLTTRISLNFTETDWSSAATYAWWLFAPFIWVFIVLCAAGSAFGIIYLGAALIDSKNANARVAKMRSRAADLSRSIN